ncbi:hypothetical protein MASR2M79_25090 [Aminivibrio sp.]
MYGKNVSEIARETGHSRNTVKKSFGGIHRLLPQAKTAVSGTRPFHETIYKWLEEDLESPKKQRHTAKRIYTRLVNEFGLLEAKRRHATMWRQ